MATFVIAEAGSCHDGSFTKALRLIDAAHYAGADAVKFQYWSSPGKLAQRRGLGPEAKSVYERCQLPKSWLPQLKKHADEAGLEFMCTAYLIEDIPEVVPLVSRFKVSAFESSWYEFLVSHPRDRTLFVSLNPDKMLAEKTPYMKVLHCVSKYPARLEDLGLYDALLKRGLEGLSDHTTSTLSGAVAVGMGARDFEKHLRLVDTHEDCPDFGHSLRPLEFRQYVANIREAELCL